MSIRGNGKEIDLHPSELLVKPYRVIYRVADTKVIIYLIVDGRRDIQTVLARRLLGG